ncbi:MAG: putative Ig domain-containing protein, partial [Chroococcales cyanobacterium]
NVTISDNTVTITPNNLESGTGYYIAIDATAIIDEVGNAFAGIDNNTTWNFTTADAPPEDPPGVTLSQTALSVTEGGATATYTVVLNSQPTADVAIAFETGNQLEPIANITFTSTNWNQTQTITVTAIDDTEIEGDHSGTITHTVTSTDATYDGITIAQVTASITDNDIANTPPVVGTPLPDNSATAGEPFSLTLPANTFSDADGDPLTFTASLENGDPLPAWLTFNPATGTFSGTPTDGDLGSLNIKVTANDGTAFVADTFTLGVSASTVLPEPPVSRVIPAVLGPTGPTAFANFIAGLPDLGQQMTSPITDIDCNCPPMPAAPMVSLAMTPTIPVTEGDDILLGTDFNDAITGFGGNDVIYGFGGDDLIVGDSGNDLLFGATGNDTIGGGTGDDVIYAGQGDDLVYGGQGDDWIYGDLGNDTLLGDKGNDTIFGGTSDLSLAHLDGHDLIYGGEGNDFLHGNAGNDTISGGPGNDTIRGGKDDDLLYGDEGDDLLWGDLGNDTLCGGDGNDTLYGGNGSEIPSTESDNDYLCGGNGDDWLIGGFGDNTLIGGAGSDRFILHHNGGTDLILDFTGGVDLIGLSSGLSFENLAITQGEVGTLITVDNQLLAILNNVNASTITADDFFSFA